jgi:hypothetical protein
MSRSIVQQLFVIVVACATAIAARAQTTPATSATQRRRRPTSAATKPAEPPQVRLSEILRVEVRDRRLWIVMTPPPAIDEPVNAGRDVTVNVAESDDSGWRVMGSSAGRDADGRYTRFGVELPDATADRWSSLRLTRVVGDTDGLMIDGVGRVGRTVVLVSFQQGQPRGDGPANGPADAARRDAAAAARFPRRRPVRAVQRPSARGAAVPRAAASDDRAEPEPAAAARR